MEPINVNTLPEALSRSLQCRQALLHEPHNNALRLFNGFTEGYPPLVVDLYGRTLVVFTHKVSAAESHVLALTVHEALLPHADWIECVLLKQRSSQVAAEKQGVVVYGSQPASSIVENEINYALDLQMNQDAGFYLDTSGLRAWQKANAGDKTVLNTFAYTGSLGVAALAGGAAHVLQIDRNARFLAGVKDTLLLNGLDQSKMKCTAVDFFVAAGQLRRRGELFDIVIIDPPYFSVTPHGRVDQGKETTRLVNKARPLVNSGGWLVVVNNALFLSGSAFMSELDELTRDGYLSLQEIIPVNEDVTGYPETIVNKPPTDPAPFNHPTKMVILKVKRKESGIL